MTGSQIQKVRNKTVKESILSEWQSRYSRNLWSSSYAWNMYNYLDISINSWKSEINFDYKLKSESETWINNKFEDRFEISSIKNWETDANDITIRYYPYQISCERWDNSDNWDLNTWSMEEILTFISRVNDNQNYCFEINKKNCRLREVKCEENE